MDDNDLDAPLNGLDDQDEKRRSKKKKKKHTSASPSKSRGSILSEKAWGLVARVRLALAESAGRTDPRVALSNCRSQVTFKKLALFVWVLVIILSVLNLLGLTPALPTFSSETAEPEEGVTSEEPVVEEIIVQKLPGPKSQKVNLAMERDFGCRELECVAACNGKAKPKCLKSRSCVIERDKICQKRCRKARCEERCEKEPHLGYVEREQGLEKCKDGCTGPTATHNKCVVKCHVKYKPCKTKCFEMASKYKCDNPKVLAATSKLIDPGHQSSKSSDSSSSSSSSSDASSSSTSDEDAAAEDDDGESSLSSSSSSSSKKMPLPDDDLL